MRVTSSFEACECLCCLLSREDDRTVVLRENGELAAYTVCAGHVERFLELWGPGDVVPRREVTDLLLAEEVLES